MAEYVTEHHDATPDEVLDIADHAESRREQFITDDDRAMTVRDIIESQQ